VIATAEVVALIAAAVAVFAAVLAVRATALVARTVLAAAPRQPPHSDGSHDPDLSVRVAGGKTRRGVGDDSRDYAFSVVLTNRTAVERQVGRSELRVAYRTRANFLGAVDLVSEERISVPPGTSTDAILRFTTSNVIPRHCRVDAYTLLLTDDRGQRLAVDASLPAVLQADTDGAGPSTWGWD
jgi:hypothetical protein